jgi:DNA helicase IV
MTVVGDVAQTSDRWGTRNWASTLDRIAGGRWRLEELTVNYRTPSEVMAVAARVLTQIDADLAPPTSVRETGQTPAVLRSGPDDLALTVALAAADALAVADGGTVGVLTPAALHPQVLAAVTEKLPDATAGEPLEAPVSVLTVTAAKGLEFDQVVLVEPASVLDQPGGLGDLYVALTRPTQQLTIVHAQPLPPVLGDLS